MAQIIVRNLEDAVRDGLSDLARSQGLSMEEMVCDILREAAMGEKAPQLGLGSSIAQRFSKIGLSEDIPEIRGQSVEPPSFEQ